MWKCKLRKGKYKNVISNRKLRQNLSVIVKCDCSFFLAFLFRVRVNAEPSHAEATLIQCLFKKLKAQVKRPVRKTRAEALPMWLSLHRYKNRIALITIQTTFLAQGTKEFFFEGPQRELKGVIGSSLRIASLGARNDAHGTAPILIAQRPVLQAALSRAFISGVFPSCHSERSIIVKLFAGHFNNRLLFFYQMTRKYTCISVFLSFSLSFFFSFFLIFC